MSAYCYPEYPTAIQARVRADALSETSNCIKFFVLSGFNSRSEVEQLARGLKARAESIAKLTLEDIVLDVEERTGFLIPACSNSCCMKAASNGASVASPEGLVAFFAEEQVEIPRRTFCLRKLSLNDSH